MVSVSFDMLSSFPRAGPRCNPKKPPAHCPPTLACMLGGESAPVGLQGLRLLRGGAYTRPPPGGFSGGQRTMATGGDRIGLADGKLAVPDRPIIPFIEGDGI